MMFHLSSHFGTSVCSVDTTRLCSISGSMSDDWDVVGEMLRQTTTTPTKRRTPQPPSSAEKQPCVNKSTKSLEVVFRNHAATNIKLYPMVCQDMRDKNRDSINMQAWFGRSWLACEGGHLGCIACRESLKDQGHSFSKTCSTHTLNPPLHTISQPSKTIGRELVHMGPMWHP
jgi:hypothetical protein